MHFSRLLEIWLCFVLVVVASKSNCVSSNTTDSSATTTVRVEKKLDEQTSEQCQEQEAGDGPVETTFSLEISTDIGESRSSVPDNSHVIREVKPPHWMVVFRTRRNLRDQSHFAGLGVRLCDRVFIANARPVIESDVWPHNDLDGDEDITAPHSDNEMSTINIDELPKDNGRFTYKFEVLPLTKYTRMYFFDIGNDEEGVGINLQVASHLKKLAREVLEQLPDAHHKLPVLESDSSVNSHCFMYTYAPIDNPTIWKFVRVPVGQVRRDSDQDIFVFQMIDKSKFKYRKAHLGSPIFCGKDHKLAFMSEHNYDDYHFRAAGLAIFHHKLTTEIVNKAQCDWRGKGLQPAF